MIRSKHAPIITAIGLAILVILAAAGIVLLISFKNDVPYSNKDYINPSVYQAVFLDNDQIYFGHLKSAGRDYLVLEDVYYVKVNDESVGQLVKLGTIEPHAPEGKMIINEDHLIFWENLMPNSPVMKTIQSMK